MTAHAQPMLQPVTQSVINITCCQGCRRLHDSFVTFGGDVNNPQCHLGQPILLHSLRDRVGTDKCRVSQPW